MKKLLQRCEFLRSRQCQLVRGTLCMALLFLFAAMTHADVPKSIDECAKIEDSAKRLKCYDEVAGRKEPPGKPTGTAASEAKPESQTQASYLERL